MFRIEWKSSHYHSDGRKRSRPKASTVHGWLVKWRATFSGNESLRKEGIREMREAKCVRELKKQRQAARRSKRATKTPSGLSFFFFGKKKKRPQRSSVRLRSSVQSSRTMTTRRVASSAQSPKPNYSQPQRSYSRHSSRSQQHRRPSRQESYHSGRTLGRSSTMRSRQQ
ncbi:hypothetical protein ID866_2566 [Astraeus odoratus]|nr:hypothetical protein ID866_2566 [Astraeus odoratus]